MKRLFIVTVAVAIFLMALSACSNESGDSNINDNAGTEESQEAFGDGGGEEESSLDKEVLVDGISYSVSSAWIESSSEAADGSSIVVYAINPETQLAVTTNTQVGKHPVSLEELDASHSAKAESFINSEHPGAEWTDGMAEAITSDDVQGYMRTWDVMYTSQDGVDIHEYDQSVEFANEALFVEMKMTVTASGEEAPDIDAAFDIFDEVAGSLLLQKQD